MAEKRMVQFWTNKKIVFLPSARNRNWCQKGKGRIWAKNGFTRFIMHERYYILIKQT